MNAHSEAPLPPRMLPPLSDTNRYFWTGGESGQLMILRDEDTGRWISPVEGRSPDGRIQPQAVSGRGTVFTYTVNRHAYHPEVEPPYVIALVELDEQEDLRLPANLVDCEPDEVRIGMPVEVRFEAHGEHWVPVFAPAPGSNG